MNIKPIDTRYGGYLFRSRREARWAVFFDKMRHSWVYEEEGFELPTGWYLPDFRIKKFDVYVEIKPLPETKEPTEADQRAFSLGADMAAAGKRFIIFYGDPVDVFSGWKLPPGPRPMSDPKSWAWEKAEMSGFWVPDFTKVDGLMATFFATLLWKENITFTAAMKAREARFEHGARP